MNGTSNYSEGSADGARCEAAWCEYSGSDGLPAGGQALLSWNAFKAAWSASADSISLVLVKEHNQELRRWQDAIHDALLDRSHVPDDTIDGHGCESGDPLDFTLAEIGQTFNWIDSETEACAEQFMAMKKTAEEMTDSRAVIADANFALIQENHELRIFKAKATAWNALQEIETKNLRSIVEGQDEDIEKYKATIDRFFIVLALNGPWHCVHNGAEAPGSEGNCGACPPCQAREILKNQTSQI